MVSSVAGVNDSVREQFARRGFCVLRQVVPPDAIRALMEEYLSMLRQQTGWRITDPWTGDIIQRFREAPDAESRIYNSIRTAPALRALAIHPSITTGAEAAMCGSIALLGKIVFRIDLPFDTAELAYWHQDRFYVKGDERIITAWLPLQDTPFERGCLGVMPGSHLDGLLPHDLVIGKRHVPRAALGREIRLVEMAAGDLLLFHSHLVHSSNLNLSETIRYSVQARFAPVGGAVDPAMGGAVPVGA